MKKIHIVLILLIIVGFIFYATANATMSSYSPSVFMNMAANNNNNIQNHETITYYEPQIIASKVHINDDNYLFIIKDVQNNVICYAYSKNAISCVKL